MLSQNSVWRRHKAAQVMHLCVVDMTTVQLAGGASLELTKAHRTWILFFFKQLVTKDAAWASTGDTAGDSVSWWDPLASHTITTNSQDPT